MVARARARARTLARAASSLRLASPPLATPRLVVVRATELQKLLLLLPYRLETFVERDATDITRPVCTLVHRVIRRLSDSDDITRALRRC